MKKRFLTLQTKLIFVILLVMVSSIAVLSSLYYLENLFRFKDSRGILFIVAIISIASTLLVFWLTIRRHVIKPVRIILRALNTGNTNVLQLILSDRVRDEWDLVVDSIEKSAQKSKQLKEQKIQLEEQKNQLEISVATKDKFLSIIAHHLKSPFHAIIGLSALILDDWKELEEEKKKEYTKNILKASEGAYALFENLLKLSRLQMGRWLPSPQRFEINNVIKSAYSFHEANAINRKVNLITDIKESFIVYADEDMIQTVLIDLISNAIKFTQTGGIVIVSLLKKANDIEIIVSDNGMGMDIKTINSLFKIGEEMISTDALGNKGTGLGLILCKEIVEKNGGEIWVESELEKGSKFHFTIPLYSQG